MRIDHDNVINTWLLEAKKLHKSTQSESVSHVLPVLRRLLNSKILVDISLPELKRSSEIIKRKHLLQLLAVENGYTCWPDLKRAIEVKSQGDELMLPYSIELNNAGYPTVWFASIKEAQAYANVHLGKVISVGEQAAWLPEK